MIARLEQINVLVIQSMSVKTLPYSLAYDLIVSCIGEQLD